MLTGKLLSIPEWSSKYHVSLSMVISDFAQTELFSTGVTSIQIIAGMFYKHMNQWIVIADLLWELYQML